MHVLTVIRWTLAASSFLAAPLAASTLHYAPPELTTPTSDCGPSHQINNEGQLLAPRSPGAEYLDECEAEDRVAQANAESERLEWELLETFRKKVFASPNMPELYTEDQQVMMEIFDFPTQLKKLGLTDRLTDMYYAEIWYETARMVGTHLPKSRDGNASLVFCLDEWCVHIS